MRLKLILVTIVLGMGQFALAQIQSQPYGIPPEVAALRLPHLAPIFQIPKVEELPLASERECVTTEGYLRVYNPVESQWEVIHIVIRRPQVEGRLPGLVVAPTIEGVTPLETRVSRTLCLAKFVTVISDVHYISEAPVAPPMDYFNLATRQNVLRLRTILDFLQYDRQVDSRKLGIIGFSLGSIFSSLVVATDPRIKAAVIVAGGGNYPKLLGLSTQNEILQLREQQIAAFHIADVGHYVNALKDVILYDPIFFGYNVDPKKVLLVRAHHDRSVVTQYQYELWEAFNRPRAIDYSLGHKGSIVRFAFMDLYLAVDFFNERFGEESVSF